MKLRKRITLWFLYWWIDPAKEYQKCLKSGNFETYDLWYNRLWRFCYTDGK